MQTLVVTDLDGTVVYPAKIADNRTPLVTVERASGRAISVMTAIAAAHWSRLAASGALVPSTTRTPGQYRDLQMPGTTPLLAIVGNGADILVDGLPDRAWRRDVERRLDAESASHEAVGRQLRKLNVHDFVLDVFDADGLYHVLGLALHALPTNFVPELRATAGRLGWRVVQHGRRVYVLPIGLEKQDAVARVAEPCDASAVLAGGDSWLDARMLAAANAAIRPAHGPLHDAGWAATSCAVTRLGGLDAGDEILTWYSTGLGAPAPQLSTTP